MHCSKVEGKIHVSLLGAALQNRLTACLWHCSCTYADLLFIQVCSDQHQCTAARFRAKWSPHYSVLLCNTGSQHVCGTAVTPMEICSSYRCAVTSPNALQHWSRQNSFLTVQCCSAKQAHSRHCVNAITPMEICSSYRCAITQLQQGSGQSAVPTVQCCSAKQAHSMFVALQLHLWRSALHTGVHCCNTDALQHWSRQNSFPAVQCCSAKQAHSMFVALHLHLCSQPQGRHYALFRETVHDTLSIRGRPHCSVLLCKTGSQQPVCHCIYTYGDWLFIQVCSDPPQMLCSTVQGKMQFPLFSVAIQNRLTAGSMSLQLHLWRFALRTGVQWPTTNALQQVSW